MKPNKERKGIYANTKIQLNQQSFGTTVKMNPRFIDDICKSSEQGRLRKQIETLENNGSNDVLSITRAYVLRVNEKGERIPIQRVFAEVYQIIEGKPFYSDTIESPTYEIGPRGGYHFPNIVDLYYKAKATMQKYNTRISIWDDYI